VTPRPLRRRRVVAPVTGPPDEASSGTSDDQTVVEGEEPRVPSWEEVARDHGRFIYTVAFRLTGNRDDAADLTQEVLLRVKRGLTTYRPVSMEGWLSRITTNVFLDEVRRRQRRPTEGLPDDADRVLPSAEGADDVLTAETLGADVQAALLSLPLEFRAAVVLSDVAGLPYAKISEALGVPVGTVRSRIHRGRVLLRQSLKKAAS
jgi:RNA polymerase sigma-70 factor, ECF subfamily